MRSYGYQSAYYTYAFLLSSLEQEHISVTNEHQAGVYINTTSFIQWCTVTNDIILLNVHKCEIKQPMSWQYASWITDVMTLCSVVASDRVLCAKLVTISPRWPPNLSNYWFKKQKWLTDESVRKSSCIAKSFIWNYQKPSIRSIKR